MSIKLFEHNQSAYESVLEMLSDEGKAMKSRMRENCTYGSVRGLHCEV